MAAPALEPCYPVAEVLDGVAYQATQSDGRRTALFRPPAANTLNADTERLGYLKLVKTFCPRISTCAVMSMLLSHFLICSHKSEFRSCGS